MSVKQKLVEIHQLALFATFTPAQTASTLLELTQFRQSRQSSSLSEIEHYNLLELEFYLSLIAGKDTEAQTCLDRLIDKFGDESSPRIAVLKATFLQATKGGEDARKYLSTRSAEEVACVKKRVALIKGVADQEEYIHALNEFLDVVPLDMETWAELAEAYVTVGHLDKAVHCYHEVLLQQSFNYYAFARIGELEHMAFVRDGNVEKLESSTKHYLRAVELCANLARAWAGVYVTTKLMQSLDEKKAKVVKLDAVALHKLAKKKLEDLVEKEDATFSDVDAAKKILA